MATLATAKAATANNDFEAVFMFYSLSISTMILS
jgi:hypothetical protein